MNLLILIYTTQFRFFSSFRSKFYESEIRIKEFGLDVKWARDLKVDREMEKSNIDAGDDGVLVLSLIWVTALGSLVSIIFFIFELVWARISKKQDDRTSKHQLRKTKNIRKEFKKNKP